MTYGSGSWKEEREWEWEKEKVCAEAAPLALPTPSRGGGGGRFVFRGGQRLALSPSALPSDYGLQATSYKRNLGLTPSALCIVHHCTASRKAMRRLITGSRHCCPFQFQ
jgi:hypothetical protein